MFYRDEARQERMGFQCGKEIKYQTIWVSLIQFSYSIIPRGPKEEGGGKQRNRK